MDNIAFFFLCAFATMGVFYLTLDLWSIWVRRRNDRLYRESVERSMVWGETGTGKYSHEGHKPTRVEELKIVKADPDEEFAELCKTLCEPAFFHPTSVDKLEEPPGDSAAAPRGDDEEGEWSWCDLCRCDMSYCVCIE